MLPYQNMKKPPEPLYEVLDEAGHKTGQTLPRAEVHKRELWHEVANVWIVNNNGEVLLQLRAPQVELCPNVWDVAVGTHVLPGEDPTAAAQRGLVGELGLHVPADKLKHLFNIQAANPMAKGAVHKVLGHVFMLTQDQDLGTLHVDPHKITRLIWKPIVEVMADVGGTETRKLYFPREGEYYPQLFDAMLAKAPPEIAS